MQLNVATAAGAIMLGFVSAAYAVEINQSGADALKGNLTRLLPKEVAPNRAITVKPAGTRYEIISDFEKMLKAARPANFAISGLVPWSIFATPQDDGLWKLEGNNALDVTGHFSVAGQPRTDFTYVIGSAIFSGIFDPAISYLRSGDFSTKALRFTSKTAAENVAVALDSSTYKLTSSPSSAPERTNFAVSGTALGFVETIDGLEIPPVEIRADSLDLAAAVNGIKAKEIRDIVVFILDHAEAEKLKPADSDTLKTMLRNAFPLVTSLNETIGVNNLTISSTGGNGGAKSLDYNVALDGPTNAMRFGFGMSARQISFDSPLVPAAYSAFLPDALQMQFALSNMDFTAFSEELLKADFNQDKMSDDSGKEAAQKLFKDGNLVMEFPKIAASSSVYDAEISGTVRGRLDNEKEYSMDATILARDLDRTIAAVQDLAKSNPDLNQLSFGLMMAKGFAKTDPDGRQRWEINVARDGAVSVNGQVIKGAE